MSGWGGVGGEMRGHEKGREMELGLVCKTEKINKKIEKKFTEFLIFFFIH